jgi:hypothetical protein
MRTHDSRQVRFLRRTGTAATKAVHLHTATVSTLDYPITHCHSYYPICCSLRVLCDIPPLLFAFVAITMSNKVWVTWKDAAGDVLHSKVTNLDDDADVDDLRKAFVDQQNLATTIPGGLEVSAADGIVLSEDATLKLFFVTPGTPESAPGKSKATALVVTFPPPQQPNGKLRCCSRIPFCMQFYTY